MTAAARSIYYFAFYLYAMGITLITVPNLFLRTLQLPETNEVWIRVVGVLALGLAYYYHRSAVQNNIGFIKLTVTVRIFVFLCFTSFVLLDYAPPILIGIGAFDALCAVWTWTALKK